MKINGKLKKLNSMDNKSDILYNRKYKRKYVREDGMEQLTVRI